MYINKVYLKGQEKVSGWNNPNKIIIHHPEFYGSVEELNSIMRTMGYSMIGYNYYIRKDGSIWQGRPVNATSANCYGQNHSSIGVCFEGNYNKDKTMYDVQFNAGVELIKYLKVNYKINEVNGHKHYKNTDCPGRYFPLQKILNAISVKGTVSNSSSLDGRIGICTGNGVRVRSTTNINSNSNILGCLFKGYHVKIFKKVGNMYSIYYGPHGGYVSSGYIELI